MRVDLATWSAVDTYFNGLLVAEDPALAAALRRSPANPGNRHARRVQTVGERGYDGFVLALVTR